MKEDVLASLAPPIDLLNDIFKWLQLKGKQFELYNSASTKSILGSLFTDWLLTECLGQYKKSVEGNPIIKSFIEHCCKATLYSFQVFKCWKTECKLFKPLCMPVSKFESIKFYLTPYQMLMSITKHLQMFMNVQLPRNIGHL